MSEPDRAYLCNVCEKDAEFECLVCYGLLCAAHVGQHKHPDIVAGVDD